jgi:hypothetical protein
MGVRQVAPMTIRMNGGMVEPDQDGADIPGTLRNGYNYEYDLMRGYLRLLGYERFDGRTAPSSIVNPDPTNPDRAARKAAHIAAIEAQRTLIQPVPGYGAVRGLFYLNSDFYALRNDTSTPTKKNVYKATSGGWSLVAGITTAVAANGFCHVTNCLMDITRGKEVIVCDGQSKAWRYNGTGDRVELTTGAADDKPIMSVIHNQRLFLAYSNGSIMFSAIGDIADFTVGSGGGEFVIDGGTPTNLLSVTGALLITTRSSVQFFYGNTIADFRLDTLTTATGALADTVKMIGEALMLGGMGITVASRIQQYGNFALASLTNRVKNRIATDVRNSVLGAFTLQKKNQYRYITPFGKGMILTMGGEVPNITTFEYPEMRPSVILDAQTTIGQRIFTGDSNGYVYELESGNSFDGAAYLSVLSLNPVYPVGRGSRCRIARVTMDVTPISTATISISASFDTEPDGNLLSQSPEERSLSGSGTALYGEATYGSAVYGGNSSAGTGIVIGTTCQSVAFKLSCTSSYDYPHIINGMTIHAANSGRIR